MDLKEFYFNNIQEEEYHYRFYDSIKDVNKTLYLIFDYPYKYYTFKLFEV